jgi:TRAP-type C4-dicarboxylate transport system permease small subunit
LSGNSKSSSYDEYEARGRADNMGRLLKNFEIALTYTAMMAAFAMMLLTTADALGRYLFRRPITGAVGITGNYLEIITVFLAMGYAYRIGAFVRVTFFIKRLPQRMKTVLNYFVQIFSLLYGIGLVIATTYHALQIFQTGRVIDATLEIPVAPAYSIIPIGLFLMSLLMFLDLRRVKEGKSALFQEESPTA